MRIEANEKVHDALVLDEDGEKYLLQILGYKFWTYQEAFNYLLGIKKINWFESEENTVLTLSNEVITETQNADLIFYLQFNSEELYEIWMHERFSNENSPEFYIKWATENEFNVPWIEFFKSNKSKIKKLSKDEELSVKERTSLMNLIAVLHHILVKRSFDKGHTNLLRNKESQTTLLKNQAELITIITSEYSGYFGIGKTKVAEMFAESRKKIGFND